MTDESAGVSSTSTDDTDATSSSSLAVNLGTRVATSAIELLISGRKDKKQRNLVLASQKFQTDIKPALNRIYPRSLIGPKSILNRFPGNQKHRCFTDSVERQTEMNETATHAAGRALDKLKGDRGISSSVLKTLSPFVLGLAGTIDVFNN